MSTITKHSGIALIALLSFALLTCSLNEEYSPRYTFYPASDNNFQYTGRFNKSDSIKTICAWAGSMITATFSGSYCAIRMRQIPIPELAQNSKYNASFFSVFIDNPTEIPDTIIKVRDDSVFVVADNLSRSTHTIRIFKRTEALCGKTEFYGLELQENSKLYTPPSRPQRRIEFIGNSITSGYGNEEVSTKKFTGETENSYLSYASITARNLNAEWFLLSYSGKGVYLNSDSSTTNTLPEIYDRICPLDSSALWNFSSWIPDVVVVNLGTNDFGTNGGVPDSLPFIQVYETFIQRIHAHYPATAIFCLWGPMKGYPVIDPVSGGIFSSTDILKQYVQKAVDNIQKHSVISIYTFQLSYIDSSIGYGAEGHPSVYQHRRNAEELTTFIKTKMQW